MKRRLGALAAPALAAIALVSRLAGAQSAAAPDSQVQKTFFVPRDAEVAGGFLVASAGLSVFDKRIAHYFEDTTHVSVRLGRDADNTFTKINETSLTVGGLVVWGIGRLTHHKTVADVALHTAEAVAAASITSQVIRGPLGRSRPSETNFDNQYDFHPFKGFTNFSDRAFPSIHSSSGFAAASVWVAETQTRDPSAVKFVAPLAYAFAITPGLARMYLGEHWASDVFAGAFLGTFYGWRVVTYSHAHPKTRIDAIFLGAAEHLQIEPGPGGRGMLMGWSQ